jgi:hypothetical protein
MPRRKSTNPAPTPKAKSRKRALSASATATPTAAAVAATSSTPGSRASKRLKESATSSPSTGKKSKYFEGLDSDDDDEPPSPDEEASDFNGGDDDDSAADPSSASPSPSASEGEDDYDSDEDRKKPKKKQQQRERKPGRRTTAAEPGAAAATGIVDKVVTAGKELWRTGVKTGLGPGKQVFIERPKPRGDGGIKYVPGRIHPNTMAFLADLKQNNDREWLKCELLPSGWADRDW